MKNIELVISNQNFDIDPVDIKILVDGKKIVEDDFLVAGDNIAQHNWQRQNIALANGQHHIKVSSKKGKAQVEKEFQVKNTLTITIAYWKTKTPDRNISTGFFTVEISENKVATM